MKFDHDVIVDSVGHWKRMIKWTVSDGSFCHADGTVTYWSVYRQCWIERARSVSDRELAAMSPHERERVIAHLYMEES